MTLLAIDTATPRLILGLSHRGATHSRLVTPAMTHGEVALQEVAILFEAAGLDLRCLEGVVIGSGPGSFTGTRVGWASALGLAEGLGIPAVAVSSLDALGWCDRSSGQRGWAIIDARRGRYYAALYQNSRRLGNYRDSHLGGLFAECPRFFGPEMPSALPPGAICDRWENWAEGLLALGREKFQHGEVIQPGQGPLYLRPGVDSP